MSGTKTKVSWEAYGKQFNTIELNILIIIPTLDLIQRWYQSTPRLQSFCPKIPQPLATVEFGLRRGAIHMFCEAVKHWKEKLGCCFNAVTSVFFGYRLEKLRPFTCLASQSRAIEHGNESCFRMREVVEDFLSY
ncbi:DUF72 domain-containing protein [Okeania hirsuta]|uniref:DUF72 domain-containing protein n=1 Tax=Okeania hirsuta TaxID=1458930 RepID=A0A3N6NWI9_9CYAN|nr:DUF72 domain-containing protein [Okeania hirsuta]